jgi:hypothetical protein
MADYLQPGWPDAVEQPGSEGEEATAVAGLLDLVPAYQEHEMGVEQEMWLCSPVYQEIYKVARIGAAAAGIPPAKISFPHALAAVTDTVAAFPPNGQTSRSPRSC